MKNHRRQIFRFPLQAVALPAVVFACTLALAPSSGDLDARDRSPGRPFFEQAYEAEKEAPADAIELYERAIKAGLRRELLKAAHWRLFYLYRKSGEYGEALRIAAHLGSDQKLKNVLGDLYKEIAVIYKISEGSARQYALGLKQLVRDREEEAALHFERALRGNEANEALRGAITRRLMRRGQSGAALALLKKIGIDREAGEGGNRSVGAAELARADLLVKLKRDAEARRVLQELARSGAGQQLNAAERSRLFYLLGRVARRSNAKAESIRWFRLAAVAARDADEDDLQSRMQGLAAYELYRGGRGIQARALLRGIPATDDANIRLLELVLRVEVDRDPSARLKLERMAPQLRSGKQSFLVRAALRLAKETPTRDSASRDGADRTKRQTPREPDTGDSESNSNKKTDAFWQREFRKSHGEKLVVSIPEKHRLLLVRNRDATQFHGYSTAAGRLRTGLRLAAPLELPSRLEDASELLRGLRGDFVLLIAPALPGESTDDESESKTDRRDTDRRRPGSAAQLPARIRLAQWIDKGGAFSERPWLIINVRSDGTGALTVELEEAAGGSRMSGYARGEIRTIEFDFNSGD